LFKAICVPVGVRPPNRSQCLSGHRLDGIDPGARHEVRIVQDVLMLSRGGRARANAARR
jgi:hypothetical protein